MLKILLIRHGQSDGNVKCVFCGKVNYPLTETGVEQGAAVCDYIFSEYRVCAVYSSELSRARQTVERLSALTGLPVVAKPQFNEIDGGKWEDKTVPFIAEHYPEDFKKWEENIGEARPTGGEDFSSLAQRAIEGLGEVVKECDGKTGVAVVATHGGVIRALQCVLSGKPLSEMKNIGWVSNASVTAVVWDGKNYSIDEKCYDGYLGEKRTVMFMGL